MEDIFLYISHIHSSLICLVIMVKADNRVNRNKRNKRVHRQEALKIEPEATRNAGAGSAPTTPPPRRNRPTLRELDLERRHNREAEKRGDLRDELNERAEVRGGVVDYFRDGPMLVVLPVARRILNDA